MSEQTEVGRAPLAPGSREPSPDGLGPSGFDSSRGIEWEPNSYDRRSAEVEERAAVLAWERGGQTTPISSYDLDRAEEVVTGATNLRAENDRLRQRRSVPTLPKEASLFAVNCTTGQWFYVNHADTWQGMPNPLRDSDGSREASVTGTGTTEGNSAGRDSGIVQKPNPSQGEIDQ